MQILDNFKNILCTVSCPDCSFDTVYRVLNEGMNRIKINLVPCLKCVGKLVISDLVYFFNYYRYHERIDGVLWLDTYFSESMLKNIHEFDGSTVITTSTFNREYLERRGIRVHAVIPRPVSEDAVKDALPYASSKVYDFVTVGNLNETSQKYRNRYIIKRGKYYFDRKRIVLFEESTKKYRSTVLSNVPPHTNVKNREVYQTLARSRWYLALSGAEGFGLPPVEALAVGTPVIYLDAHAYRDWLTGLKVRTVGKQEVEFDLGKVTMYEVDEEDLKDKIEYAMNLDDEEYNKLARNSFEEGKKFYSMRIATQIMEYLSKYIG